jgi:hypothetical protein
MWKYGRKVIDALFKRRTERTPVRAELERRSEADSSRSDIRVFEVGLSAERHGDYEQGTRNAAQTAEGARLIAIAKVSADGDNVLTDGERLYFIDPIIKLKASAVDVLNYYYGVLK